jgi:hypothetical protein
MEPKMSAGSQVFSVNTTKTAVINELTCVALPKVLQYLRSLWEKDWFLTLRAGAAW